MTFEEYLTGKKIDSRRFREQAPEIWTSWLQDFQRQHPASFTAQKLYLINPVRRKYPLKPPSSPVSGEGPPSAGAPRSAGKPAARPVFKPKPKM